MTTALDVFTSAMALMDEVDETTGSADTEDTREYKNRTLPIINLLVGELFPYSDTFKQEKTGKRPTAAKVEDFETGIGIDDYLCRSIMPYGLAAHLMMQEDPVSANFFQQRYDELKMLSARGMPAEIEDIEDVYGGVNYGQFARW